MENEDQQPNDRDEVIQGDVEEAEEEVEGENIHNHQTPLEPHVKRPPLVQRALNYLSLNPIHRIAKFSDNCFCVDITPNGETAAFCSVVGELLIVDLVSMAERHFFKFPSEGIYSLAWSPSGRYLALGGDDLEIIILDRQDWKPINRLSGHYGCVQDLAWLENEPYLVSASMDFSVRVWDVFTGEALYIFFEHEGDVNALSLSHDHQFLFSGSQDFKINIFRVSDWDLVTSLQLHRGPIYDLATSPNLYIASASNDGTVQIISYYDWRPVQILYFEEQLIRALAWSPCGEFLAVGVYGNIYLVSTSLWQIVVEYQAHTKSVESLTWHPEGKYLLSTGRNEEIFIYENPFVKFSKHSLQDFQAFDPGRLDYLSTRDAKESLEFRYKMYLKFLKSSKSQILDEFHAKLTEFHIQEPNASLLIEHVESRIGNQYSTFLQEAEQKYTKLKEKLKKTKFRR